MLHVEVVCWLGATISCFKKGLLCILEGINKENIPEIAGVCLAYACGEKMLKMWTMHAHRMWPGLALHLPGLNGLNLDTQFKK